METFAQDPLAIKVSSGADSSHESHLLGNVNEITPALPSPNAFDEAEASSTDTLSLEKETATGGGGIQVEGSCRCFSLDEVQRATNDFDDALVIGSGGFGKVYKGIIDDDGATTTIAIKRLNAESKQGAEEFRTEVKLLSKLRHTHLVSLIGYCYKLPEMILVYEYITGGTLASHLYKTSREESGRTISQLTWEQRLKICLGAACGLDYLHNGTKQGIIHRDVKSTNILVDKNLVAKVSDFGLSKSITSHSRSHVSTKVKGTIGYLDPDYFYTNRLTKKSDVYAFGVVLLEVLCGRPPVDRSLDEEQISLILWATTHIKKRKIDGIIDPSLVGETTPRNLKYFAELAKKCLHTQPKERPTMAEVVESLEIALVSYERERRSQGIKLVPKGISRWLRDSVGSSKQLFPEQLSYKLAQSGHHRFSLEEVRAATNGFDEDLLFEKDTYFRFCMVGVGETLKVAIKRYNSRLIEEVSSEIQVQSPTHHPNIVSLIGYHQRYFDEQPELILVYEYMVNGTLTSHLRGTGNDPLPWKKRLEICIDIARGLESLHANEEQQFIRKIMSSNIFLDDNWVANVAAFELAVPIPAGFGIEGYQTTRIVGTPAHMAPEYVLYGKLTKKSDVYSFGVVLLEVLCAKGPCNLESDVYNCIGRGAIDEIIDLHLIGKIAPECFRRYVNIALSCLVNESNRRPSMDDVLGSLQSALQLQEAWENSVEIGDELPMADVPWSYNDVVSVDSEFTIGRQSFLISNLVQPYAQRFLYQII